MTNQTSEDKQTKAIYEAMQIPYLSERHDAIKALIRNEKLKLLAEVRERVVGECDLVDAEILKKLYDKAYSNGYNDRGYENSYNSHDYRSAEEIAPVIAKIRGGYDKRFAALTKLEAEL